MANSTIYPYGTGGGLPSSIGIINDLVTGGANKAEGDASGNNFFAGKIYSIRLYNRQLTSTEVAANLAVDNIRFSMGLTL